MDDSLRIEKQFSLSGSLGSTFDRELRQLLWRRVLRVLIIALCVSLIARINHYFLARWHAEPVAGAPEWAAHLQLAHTLSFVAALLFLLAARRWLCHLKLMSFTFLLGVLNLAVAILYLGFVQPGGLPIFEIALLLFLPAALIPWRTGFQLGLAGAALAIFLGSVAYLWRLPGYRDFWTTGGGQHGPLIDHVVQGGIAILLLGTVSVVASHTLYSLRRTVHRAQRLGNYLIRRELGRGGMGTVYLAEHAFICRPTAVKVLQIEDGRQEADLQRFEREVRLSAQLTHPHTIAIYDYGRSGGNVFYYAMEYLDGMDLQKFGERFGALPPARAVHLLLQICGALGEAHARGIVHRDIKPSNIFLTQRGGICDYVKVLDFGLAEQIAPLDDSSSGRTTGPLGTPRYIAPEVITGEGEHGPLVDVYNLGGVGYWLLTGQPPFTAESSLQLLKDHLHSDPLPPSAVAEHELPPALEAIVMRCLRKTPSERFGSVQDVRDALAAVELSARWDERRAREWWQLHGLLARERAAGEGRLPPAALDDSERPEPSTVQVVRPANHQQAG
jgi:tRNA A-37 threonylcarbamoyl transferase component Bud32